MGRSVTTIVITGSTRGIGRGLAEQLLARGADVVVSGRSADTVEQTVEELTATGRGRVTGRACDVRSRKDLQALWDLAVEEYGTVDLWINNAGISAARRPLWEISDETVEAVVETNLSGTIFGTQVALAGMTRQGHGTVYNLEGFGSNGQKAEGMGLYGATKRAVSYLSDAANKDLGDGVRVGTISPGIVVTDLLAADYEDQPEKFEEAKRIFNILGDHVEPVTSFIADKLLASDSPPRRIQWLTKRKAFLRFATAPFRKRDLFA